MSSEVRLGVALKQLRKDRGLTLSQVSEQTGLSISTLSKVERNRLSLTYDKLAKLADGLEVDIRMFFEEPGDPLSPAGPGNRRSVSRRDQGHAVDTTNFLHRYLNTDLLKRRFITIEVDVRARTLSEFGPLVRHAGEEFAYVLEGVVEVHTEHYAPCRLEVGDSIHFDSTMAHAYIAGTPGRCRLLAVNSAPEEDLRRVFSEAGDG